MTRNYVEDIQNKNLSQLLRMLEDISKGVSVKNWPPGIAFEHIVLRAFEIEQATVSWPYSVRLGNRIIEQIDGAVYWGGLACLVESKDYNIPINIEPIAKLKTQLSRRPAATLGIVFSRHGYTGPAKELTRLLNPLNILLWEYEEFEQCIAASTMCRALSTKYQYAVEFGIPDYDIRQGLR